MNTHAERPLDIHQAPAGDAVPRRSRLARLRTFLHARVELPAWIAEAVRDLIRRHRQARAVRRQRQLLAELDERTLKDIGLHRAEIDSMAAELEGYAAATRHRGHKDSVAPLY